MDDIGRYRYHLADKIEMNIFGNRELALYWLLYFQIIIAENNANQL